MKKFLFLECAIMVMIVTAGWLFGAKTLFDFSQFFLWGGVVVMAFGMVSLMGQWGARTDFTYLIARTTSDQNEINRAHQTFSDIRNSFSFLFETLILGGIPLIVGLLLNWFLN